MSWVLGLSSYSFSLQWAVPCLGHPLFPLLFPHFPPCSLVAPQGEDIDTYKDAFSLLEECVCLGTGCLSLPAETVLPPPDLGRAMYSQVCPLVIISCHLALQSPAPTLHSGTQVVSLRSCFLTLSNPHSASQNGGSENGFEGLVHTARKQCSSP